MLSHVIVEHVWNNNMAPRAFQFFILNGFVRRASEPGQQRITEFDGFGEPSYKLRSFNKTKALIWRRGGLIFSAA